MKSKQVLSVEQMKHLQELRLDTSDASMYWARVSHGIRIDDKSKGKWFLSLHKAFQTCGFMSYESIPTYTLQDILGKLPRYINDFGTKYKLHIESTFAGPWCISYQIGICEPFVFKLAENPLNAAYEMLCWCIENGYVKNSQL